MNESIKQALERDRTIDITTTGRQSGKPRRIEIWFHRVEGGLFITGTPGPRDWYANLKVHPEFTFHLKESAQASLPARARPVEDPDDRRRIMGAILEDLGHPNDLAAWVAGSPLVEVELEEQP